MLVNLPHGKSSIGVKWIYKLEFNMDGSISKHKAPLVAQGYVQQEGIVYNETFTPVARMETIIVKVNCLSNEVKYPFLNGYLNEEVSLDQLMGFIHMDKNFKFTG